MYTYLEIDNQGFAVVEQTTKKRAEWYAKMVGIALSKFLNRELINFVETASIVKNINLQLIDEANKKPPFSDEN